MLSCVYYNTTAFTILAGNIVGADQNFEKLYWSVKNSVKRWAMVLT